MRERFHLFNTNFYNRLESEEKKPCFKNKRKFKNLIILCILILIIILILSTTISLTKSNKKKGRFLPKYKKNLIVFIIFNFSKFK